MTVGVQPALAAATPYRLSVPSGYVSSFSDVQEDDWYYDYVAVLNSRGMIDGYGNGLFGANDPLTSGAALVMVLKAAGSGDLAATGDHWASGYADYAVSQGYLTQEQIGDLDQPCLLYTSLWLFRYHFIESLILAQDERWRRA